MMIDYIETFDLEYVKARLVNKCNWTSEDADAAIRRYRNYLILRCKYPTETLVPAHDIDEVWHNHILHTYEYMRDCEKIFGAYLHHAPFSETEDPKAKEGMEKAYYRAAALYMQEFQEAYSNYLDVATFW